MEKCILGIDVGTTGTKSILVTEDGSVLASAYEGYALRAPCTGQCEQDANDWWRAVVRTVRKTLAETKRARHVVAVSLSLQGGTVVAVDSKTQPLCPAIVWSDTRCEAQRRQFADRFGEEYMYQKTGWKLGRGMNAMQIAWLRDNRPDVFQNAAMFLSVADFLSMRMTGRAVVDISDAGISQLADIRKGAYAPGILDFVGIDERRLAQIQPSAVPVGTLLPEAAAELGLPETTLLVVGAHDQYAALLGAGIMETGDVLIGTGTAWVVTALADEPDFSTGFAQSVPAAGNWGSLVSISSGGVCLDWFRNRIASSDEAGGLSYAAINESCAKRSIGENGLFFYPFFSGGAFPINEPDCQTTLLGLDLSHDRFDIARAIMEGVAMQTAWTIEHFRERFAIRSLKLAGGAAKSPFWTQMVADICDCAVKTPCVTDLACIGAAVMAGVGSGLFRSCEEGIARINVRENVYTPNPSNAARYREHFCEYKRRARMLPGLYK